MEDVRVSVAQATRLGPKATGEKAIPLSLLDCTTADFAPASAIWMYEKPKVAGTDQDNLLRHHMRRSLGKTLEAYPQWCGQLKIVNSTDGSLPPEAQHFPAHARRFGRIYAHYGTPEDPGVELVWAKSSSTLQSMYPKNRTAKHPLWNCHSVPFHKFLPTVPLANPLRPNVKDKSGKLQPLMAIQITRLGCGGFVLALKSTHAIADASSFMYFLRDWAKVSKTTLAGQAVPRLSPLFDPSLLDNQAAGDINANQPDKAVIAKAESLPMHRYDWWASAATCPWPFQIPAPIDAEEVESAGEVMPWSEWDPAAPLSNYVLHFTPDQVESLWQRANKGSLERLSRHDAILGHVWSCITRARNLASDHDAVHCDLVYGVRPSFQLPNNFMGSPIIMTNIALPASEVAAAWGLSTVAGQVRETLRKVVDPSKMAAHLHSVAYEKSPQRIWQGFPGRRHIMVTTWARAGFYNLDFGLGSRCVFVEGVVPDMDGVVLIKEAPGTDKNNIHSRAPYWTSNGVDVSVRIRTEDMERLLKDPNLLPVGKRYPRPLLEGISSRL